MDTTRHGHSVFICSCKQVVGVGGTLTSSRMEGRRKIRWGVGRLDTAKTTAQCQAVGEGYGVGVENLQGQWPQRLTRKVKVKRDEGVGLETRQRNTPRCKINRWSSTLNNSKQQAGLRWSLAISSAHTKPQQTEGWNPY